MQIKFKFLSAGKNIHSSSSGTRTNWWNGVKWQDKQKERKAGSHFVCAILPLFLFFHTKSLIIFTLERTSKETRASETCAKIIFQIVKFAPSWSSPFSAWAIASAGWIESVWEFQDTHYCWVTKDESRIPNPQHRALSVEICVMAKQIVSSFLCMLREMIECVSKLSWAFEHSTNVKKLQARQQWNSRNFPFFHRLPSHSSLSSN